MCVLQGWQFVQECLQVIEEFRARDHKEKENKDKSEQQRAHEATHKLSEAKLAEEDQAVGKVC